MAADARLLLEVDLSILAASWPEICAYELAVRGAYD